jgi:hypothetical protein
LDWSKSLTVKEKIILHLLSYSQYSDIEEVPEDLTQQGIATWITAPRPHVSMALKDLKTKEQLTEHTSRIIQGKRKQKVYFLTPEGMQIGNGLKRRLLESEIKIIDGDIEEVLSIGKICTKYKISIMELLNSITAEGVCDIKKIGKKPKLTIPAKPQKPPISQKQSIQNIQSKQPKLPIKPEKYAPVTQTKPTSAKAQVPSTLGQMPTRTPQSDAYYTHSNPQENYLNYLYQYYPEYYNEYYSEFYKPVSPRFSVKANLIFFSVGYILMLLGVISGLYFIIATNFLFVIPMVLFITIGVTVIAISGTELWNNETWGNRILNLFVVTVPLELYLLIYFILDPGLSYQDLGLWLIIVFSFMGLAIFGSFIPLSHRAWSLIILGFIIFINSILLFFIDSISIFNTGFWLLIGILCFYTSYNLVDKNFDELVLGITLGVGLGIILACGVFISQYNFESARFDSIFIFIIIGLWIIVGIFLIALSIRDKDKSANIIKTVSGLYSSTPIYFGIVLIFFGVFLLTFDKLIETIIELFLGGIVIIYGVKRILTLERSSIALSALIALAITATFALILIG